MRGNKLNAMLIAIAVLAAGHNCSFAQHDKVPVFDMEPTCRGAVTEDLSPEDKTTKFETCMQQEQQAQAELEAKWSTFPASDRSFCTGETQVGGPPSYVDMVGCLQDAQFEHKLEETSTQ